MLTEECSVNYYETRNHEILQLFNEVDGVPYLCNVRGFFDWLNVEYVVDDWRLVIKGNKSALRCVLVHNGNKHLPIPLLYSPTLNGTYNDIKFALNLINYNQHKWKVIVDFKLLKEICGTDASVNPCVLCDRYRARKSNNGHLQDNSVSSQSVIELKDVLFPSLQVKIGLVAQFIKALSTDCPAFDFICSLFASNRKSQQRMEAGRLDATEICELLKQSDKLKTLFTRKECRAWIALEEVCNNFLVKNRAKNYKEIAAELVNSYEDMGCSVSYELHIMDCHIDDFTDNRSEFPDEMGAKFYEHVRTTEECYQERYDKFMLADYCWLLKRETELESINMPRS